MSDYTFVAVMSGIVFFVAWSMYTRVLLPARALSRVRLIMLLSGISSVTMAIIALME